MSDLRIALVAEGVTDLVVIRAALKAILGRPFILTQLQPEPTMTRRGQGWCGVFNWCREFASRKHATLNQDPVLAGFDLCIIHLDADVGHKKYADGGGKIEDVGRSLLSLPCDQSCPPASTTVDELRARVLNWLGIHHLGSKAVFCVPSKSTGTWMACAALEDVSSRFPNLECRLSVDDELDRLRLQDRIRKSKREYEAREVLISGRWNRIEELCSQALRFRTELQQQTH
jgi:hypothetical protein